MIQPIEMLNVIRYDDDTLRKFFPCAMCTDQNTFDFSVIFRVGYPLLSIHYKILKHQ